MGKWDSDNAGNTKDGKTRLVCLYCYETFEATGTQISEAKHTTGIVFCSTQCKQWYTEAKEQREREAAHGS